MRERILKALLAVSSILISVLLSDGVIAPTYAADTLVIGVQNDTPNLAPWDLGTNSYWKGLLWRNWVYEGLLDSTPDGTIYPKLASSYDQLPSDPYNITIHIRQGITFTDGASLNATDVVFTYQVMAFNSVMSSPILNSIVWQDPPAWPRWNASMTAWGAANPSHVGVVRIDDYTVRLQMRQRYTMIYSTLGIPIMPSHIWKDHLVAVDPSWYPLPGGDIMTQGIEFDFDSSFGTKVTDTQATIGTGPWYLVDWVPGSSLNMSAYGNYWGKSESVNYLGTDYPFFPRNVRNMYFRIYWSLDEAALALRPGDVHVVPWNLPLADYNDFRFDPRMGFIISPTDAFYYMAFNMRKAPFNDINFRRAVSYVIDKDFIVDRLLGGFGSKGQVPISPLNPAYINSSALTPPLDFNQARSILDAAGYVDSNGDGWRETLGGNPMHFEILTPTVNYDPVRAGSGTMIANNLKSIGLNVDSVPLAFGDLINAIWVAVQFDMYVLGWVHLGMYPETYLGDFFACGSDVLLGIGDNTPGFCDPGFEQLLNVMNNEMDYPKRMQAVKDAEGILTDQLPYNTLYYVHQIEAYRADIWTGWISVYGEIFNGYSVNVLAHTQLPDYVPVNPAPSTGSTVPASSQIPLSIQVLNQGSGGAPGDATVAFYNLTSPASPFANYTLAPLGPGTSSNIIAATWVAPSMPGTYQVAVDVDYHNDVAELDEANNTYVWTFLVLVLPRPVTNLVIGQPNWTSGTTYVRTSTPLDFVVTDMNGQGIHNTTYRIDNAAWVEYTPGLHFYLPAEGEHNLEWYSVDNLGITENVKSRVIRVDDTPPTTAADLEGRVYQGNHTYVRSTTLVRLVATDGGVIKVGVQGSEYRLPGGQWVSYATPFIVGGLDGLRKIEYRSTDLLGNTEDAGNITVFVDDTFPQTLLVPSTQEFTTDTTFELVAVDNGSGVSSTMYSIDGGAYVNYTGKFQLSEGDHTITFWSEDRLGHIEATAVNVTIKGKSTIDLTTILLVAVIVVVAIVAVTLILLMRRKKRGAHEAEEPPGKSTAATQGPKS